MPFGSALKSFLIDPLSNYTAFFCVCSSRIRGILFAKLGQAAGGGLTGADSDLVDEVSSRVMLMLFGSARHKPFHALYEYFRRLGVHDFEHADPTELERMFAPLLFVQVRQALVDEAFADVALRLVFGRPLAGQFRFLLDPFGRIGQQVVSILGRQQAVRRQPTQRANCAEPCGATL